VAGPLVPAQMEAGTKGSRPKARFLLVIENNNGSILGYSLLPPYRIIGQICILRQILTINFSKKYEIFDIKIIPLKSSFKCESNGIIFI
jgi:hypothetical protein